MKNHLRKIRVDMQHCSTKARVLTLPKARREEKLFFLWLRQTSKAAPTKRETLSQSQTAARARMGQLSSSTKGRCFNEPDPFSEIAFWGARTFDSGKGRGVLRHNNFRILRVECDSKTACAATTLRAAKTRIFSEPKFVTLKRSENEESVEIWREESKTKKWDTRHKFRLCANWVNPKGHEMNHKTWIKSTKRLLTSKNVSASTRTKSVLGLTPPEAKVFSYKFTLMCGAPKRRRILLLRATCTSLTLRRRVPTWS